MNFRLLTVLSLFGATLTSTAAAVLVDAEVVAASPGEISIIAGDGAGGYTGDGGPAVEAQLNYPRNVAIGGNGDIFIADTYNNRIRKISSSGIITTVAVGYQSSCGGITTSTYQGEQVLVIRDYSTVTVLAEDDGEYNAQMARIYLESSDCSRNGLAMDSTGSIYYAADNRIWKIPAPFEDNEEHQLIAGTGVAGFSGDGGPATNARLNRPGDLALDSMGNVYFSDTTNRRIRKVDTEGVISTFAGNGAYGSAWRGIAKEIALGQIYDIAFASNGSLVIKGQNSFGRINSDGSYCRFALADNPSLLGDSWYFYELQGMAIDESGSVIFSSPNTHQVLKVESPSCPPTIEEVLAREGDLEFFNAIYKASSNPSEFSVCDYPNTVFAPNDLAIQDLLSEVGTTLNGFKSDQTLSGPLLSDHRASSLSPAQLESNSTTSVYLSSGRSAPVTQRPEGPPGSRAVGTNVYVNDSLITRKIQVCGGGWTGSYMYVLDKRTYWPPTALGMNPMWGYASTPTNARQMTFKLYFGSPVRGLTSSSFVNMGSQAGCLFTPIARDRTSEYSQNFDVLASCSGAGTVAPRLRTSSVTTPFGIKYVSDPYGANVVDIQTLPVLTIMKLEYGSGVVESTSISGIECGELCVGVFERGVTVTLKATPDLGSIFTGWSGACSGTAVCTVKMDAARTVSASFVPTGSVVVVKTGNGGGSVSSQPGGISCPASSTSPCLGWIRYGTSVTLTATASRGSKFLGWLGDCSGTGKCVLNMQDNKIVYPIFERS